MKIFLAALLAVAGISLTVTARDLSEFKTADELWRYIVKMQQEGPTEMPQTPEDHKTIAKHFLGQLDAALAEFCLRYPADPRRWEAKLARVRYGNLLASLDGRDYNFAADEPVLKEVAAAADATPEMKSQAGSTLVMIHIAPLLRASTVSSGAVAAVDAELAAFEKQFPDDPEREHLELVRAQLYEKTDPARAAVLMTGLTRSGNADVADEAQGYLVALDLGKQPLDLKFPVVDGAPVDLAKWRGKVVLLDFWASWCGPCVMSIPGVVATYNKFHGRGFEVVGISLDHDKDKLLAFAKDKGMAWPQYFDGKVWDNDIGARFHVHAIPAMWLVDKKGYVRPLDDSSQLPAQVEKLLAE